MKRVIKFRAWDWARREWKSPANVYVNGNGETIWQFGDDIEPYSDVHLVQFTGLLDRNGVEIYEGDIVEMGQRLEVVYEDDGFYGLDHHKDFRYNGRFLVAGEVVGNRYENPELLGGVNHD